MTINDDLSLLVEYNQWVATRKLPMQDTSPEEFMRDRLKEVAMDRINDALAYLGEVDQTVFVTTTIEILEGRVEYIRTEGDGNSQSEPEDTDETHYDSD